MKKRDLRKKLVKILDVVLTMALVFTSFCFATEGEEVPVTGIQNTTLVKGTEKLIQDLTNWLLIIAPTITILLVGYYFMRKSASDEMDGKRWDNRVKVAIVCCIGVVVASGLIKVLVTYYN